MEERRRAKTIIDSFASKLPPRTYIKTVAPPETPRQFFFAKASLQSEEHFKRILSGYIFLKLQEFKDFSWVVCTYNSMI
jgi:hypothetical protein